MPALKGMSIREVLKVLNNYPVKIKIKGSGLAFRQYPKVGSKIKKGMKCNVVFK